jgi:hypothetical protein
MSGSFSKQKSNQSSQSTQTGVNLSSSFGDTASSSSSSSSSQQDVFLADLLSKVYGGAAGAAADVNTGDVSSAAKQLFSGGLDFLGNLNGNAGTDALTARLTDTSSRDAQLASLKTTLGDFFNEKLLPGITSRGVASGTLGGSRDAVELGAATKEIGNTFSTGAASIISSDQAARDAAAGKLADVTNTGAGTGLSALQSLYGLSSAGQTAGLLPYQILSQIIGGPTVLGSSSSSSLASSTGQQGSSSYGFDTAQSTSQGSGSGFSIGGGVGFSVQKTV